MTGWWLVYPECGLGERERERYEFCVINVKYKEISWRVRKKRREKKSNF